MYKKKPFFIVFEGVEGCGKSFQSKNFIKTLKIKLSLFKPENLVALKLKLIRNLCLKIILQTLKKNSINTQIHFFIV